MNNTRKSNESATNKRKRQETNAEAGKCRAHRRRRKLTTTDILRATTTVAEAFQRDDNSGTGCALSSDRVHSFQRSELSHSLVSSCSIGCANHNALSGDPKNAKVNALDFETLVLPARRVHSTDTASIGSAVVEQLGQYVFGSSFTSFLMDLKKQGFTKVEVCLYPDSVASGL